MTPEERDLLLAVASAVTTIIASVGDRSGLTIKHAEAIYRLMKRAGLDYEMRAPEEEPKS